MDKRVKDLLDTLKGTASAVGETMAGVTREGAKMLSLKREEAKLSVEVVRLRSAIESLYSEIGKAAYQVHVTGDDAEAEKLQEKVNGLMEEIDEKQEEIAKLNRQIDLLGGGVLCEKCGRVSPEEYEYCPVCGSKLEKPVKEECSCCSCGEAEEAAEPETPCGCDACGEEAAEPEAPCGCSACGTEESACSEEEKKSEE